jgi:hypothetical protein
MAAAGFALLMSSGRSNAACLQKPGPTNIGIPTYMFMIAPESAVPGYLAFGFLRVNCPSDMKVVRNFVVQLCAGTGNGDIPPIATDLAFGVSQPRACADAKAGLAEAGG